MAALPHTTSACVSWEPGETTIPNDKTLSKDNTHRTGESEEHDPTYAISKLQHRRDEKLGMKPSQSSIDKCSSKGLSFLSKREKKKKKGKF